jgi:transposase
VACLRATGRPVYVINPNAVARYRERRSVSGAESDKPDAAVLAHVLRTDMREYRPLPANSELAQVIAVLARAQQDAGQAQNRLRSRLREYFPGFLAAFASAKGGITRPEALVILAAAPTPADAARLTRAKARRPAAQGRPSARHRAGSATAARRVPPAADAPAPLVEQAMGKQALALLSATSTPPASPPRSSSRPRRSL